MVTKKITSFFAEAEPAKRARVFDDCVIYSCEANFYAIYTPGRKWQHIK